MTLTSVLGCFLLNNGPSHPLFVYHIFFTAAWNSAGLRWRLSPTERVTESQAAACGDETESSRALSGKEALQCICVGGASLQL